MLGALGRWLVLTVAVWLAVQLIPGLHCTQWPSLLIAALTLGILNALVKPLLLLISMPLIIISLGLFLIPLNALLLELTAALVPGFEIANFWAALGGGLVISAVSFFFGRPRRGRLAARRMSQPPPSERGPIIDI